MKAGDKLTVNVIEVDPDAHSLIFGLPRPEGEEDRGEQRGGGERRGGGRGGDRRDGEGFRGGDRGRFGGPVTAVNELKTAETVSNFALGDMIGDAIKKRLNYSEPEAPKEEATASSTPVPPAPPAPEPPVTQSEQPAPAAPAAPESPAESSSSETASQGDAPDSTPAENAGGDVSYTTSFEQDNSERSSEESAG